MTVRRWRKLVGPMRNAVLATLVDRTGCGPFDGGCVVFAEALRRVVGGEIVVLQRADGTADHAAVSADGLLWDMDGPLAPERFVARFNRTEFAACTGFRQILPDDLPDAVRDDDASAEIARLLPDALSDDGPHPSAPAF